MKESVLSATTTQVSPVSGRRLSGNLGPFAIIFMIMAAAAPLTTVSATVPVGLIVSNGAAFPIMYVAAAVLLVFFGIGFVAMTPHVKRSGAFYSYVTEGIGRGTGIATSYLAMLTYNFVQIAVHAFMGVVLSDYVLAVSGVAVPWWIFTLVVLAIIGVLGYLNIDLSAKVLAVVLVGEILICLVFNAVVTAVGGGPEGLTAAPLIPAEIFSGAPALGLMLAASGFLGFEAAAVFRSEARNPDRTIPRAVYGSLAAIGIFYCITAWSMVNAWGAEGAIARAETASSTMLVDAISNFLGPVGYVTVQYLLMASTFACILSFHNVITRYMFSMANSGVITPKLGRSHPKHKSPARASLTQSIAAAAVIILCAILGLEPISQVFTWTLAVAGTGILLLMLVTCAAVVSYFTKANPGARHSLWKCIIAPVIGALGLAFTTFMTVREVPASFGGNVPLTIGFMITIPIVIAIGYIQASRNRVANTEEIEVILMGRDED